MKTIDARGLACPEPVLLTKRAFDAGEKTFIVLVDDDIPKENIKRFCDSQNCVLTESREAGVWKLTVNREGQSKSGTELRDAVICAANAAAEGTGSVSVTLLITRDIIGDREELGGLLMEGMINTLPDAANKPAAVIFLNAGVRLAAEGSPVLPALLLLNEQGVAIKACGTCLDFYGLKDKLRVGVITNMFETVETITGGGKVVTL